MRFFKSLTALLLVLSFTFTSCGDAATATEVEATMEAVTETAHGEGAAFTSAYVCPMHCEGSGSDQAGECPKCGMAYIAQAEHTDNGHKH